ncbi:hypothetical protein L1987_19750 [Smallanthus sonchifolius]|uniref:Uncharacterized protein n=1 Tax=Smallanthus sonchifolius TaxID=185202 RepID=A0ACB9IRZ3_9ASTR|nr:hypothetical protein L1987_19750 [Smallanthus sonchifolius]
MHAENEEENLNADYGLSPGYQHSPIIQQIVSVMDMDKALKRSIQEQVFETPTPTSQVRDSLIPSTRKKSIAKSNFTRSEEVITPDPKKYKKLFSHIDLDDEDMYDRSIENMVYFLEHGHKWKDIFLMTDIANNENVNSIRSKMIKEELERDRLVFWLKAIDFKNKQVKNMKIETLKSHVERMKREKAIARQA